MNRPENRSASRWGRSNRTNQLPVNWPHLRNKVLKRDQRKCKLKLDGCITTATQVDHIIRGNDHRMSNLQAVCVECHNKKSSREGNQELARLRQLKKRPQENHPGLGKSR